MPVGLLYSYLVVAQYVSAFEYSLGVRTGTQEPADRITEVGVAFFSGFAGADLVYTPLLAFCASVNLDAFIAIRSSPSRGESSGKL